MRDYHVHTNNSFDSKEALKDYCERAIELGVKEIAFTEHFDLNPKDESNGFFSYQKYFSEICEVREMYSGRIRIISALELGEPHLYVKEHKEFIQDKEFEILIGSVHFIGQELLKRKYGEEENAKDIYLTYFEEVLRAINEAEFNILGHLDVIKRYVPKRYGRYNPYLFRESIEEILKVAIKKDIALEINSSGLRQSSNEPLPSYEIFSWYRKLGGKLVVFGSDAHKAVDLAGGYKLLEEAILTLGFKGFAKLENKSFII